MADCNTVCSMCGDVGFADKLFRCLRCRSRFQHSYCTNYYYEEPSETAGVCDWCLSERYELPVKKPTGRDPADQQAGGAGGRRTAYVKGDKVKQSSRGGGDSENHGASNGSGSGSGSGSSSSSKPSGRRYKLLKDVLC